MPAAEFPAEAIPAAGYVPGVPRLGLPALFETDASLGIANPMDVRAGEFATALPSSLALAASFNLQLAQGLGALLGDEAHAKGFNVLLGVGVNLARDPRSGRNFEGLGEDPLLAGLLAAEQIHGVQGQHVIATLKHFALDSHETNSLTLDARIDESAARESDLLAFELALERSDPGAVMCSYNLVNGSHACGNDWLLNQVLKGDWQYRGWVMSDWGAVHSVDDALHGLDQESGEQFDPQVYFGAPLAAAVAARKVPMSRIDDMARRILRSAFVIGAVDQPPRKADIDYKAHAALALEEARQGIVLLRNEAGLLPLPATLRRIAVIGGNAHVGVLSGGGSAQVAPSNGAPVIVPIGGRAPSFDDRKAWYLPGSPLAAIRAAAPQAHLDYDAGSFPADAAALAAGADVAIVFVTRHELEGYDVPNLRLPNGQDELVSAVAAANARTIVVLESGNPVAMPWVEKVAGVLAAWYPGQEGGRAIADVLFGAVNPSGRLPVTFPLDDEHTMRPKLPNLGADPAAAVGVDYSEGADVGYRWYLRHGVQPLYPFGYGLSYASFSYGGFDAQAGRQPSVSFTVTNTSQRAGADVPQVYLVSVAGKAEPRLLGFRRVQLNPGETQTVRLNIDPRLLAHYDEAGGRWRMAGGVYKIVLARSALDAVGERELRLAAREFR
jgi:beta-glucosidase